jgi:hypothetical protein
MRLTHILLISQLPDGGKGQLFTQYPILCHNSFHAIIHLLVMGTGMLGVSKKGPQTSLKRTRCSSHTRCLFRCHVLKFLVRNSLACGNNMNPGAHSVTVLIWRALSQIYIFSLHLILSIVPSSCRLSCFVLCAFIVF